MSDDVAKILPSVFNVIAANYERCALIIYILDPLSKWTILIEPTFLSGQANTQTSFEGLIVQRPFVLRQVSITSIILRF